MTSIGGLNCTLPVALNEDGWDDHYITGTPHGGFVSFPSARLSDDPASRVRFADSGSLVTSVAKPVLDGRWPGPVFDWQLKRWVPAMNPAVVSPDGSAYVYAQDNNDGGAMSTTRLRVVTVSTGNDRLLLSRGRTDDPIAWTKEGIYVVQVNFEASSSGLLLINPATGAERIITSSGSWLAVSAGAAWGFAGVAYTNSDFYPHTIDRLDLATGKVTNWYRVPAHQNVHLAAVDLAGRPIIVVDQYHVFRLAGRAQAEPLFDSQVPIRDESTPQVDSHGLWFTSVDIAGDIWFYSDGTGLRKVAELGRAVLNIEGPCR